MSAHDHLNQLEFEGMPARREGTPAADYSAVHQAAAKFGPRPASDYSDDGAHMGSDWGREDPLNSPNPLYEPDSLERLLAQQDRDWEDGRFDTTFTEELVPPWRVFSSQKTVNMDAVEHQVEHADPMNLRDQPDLYPVTEDGVERYFPNDGNHRTLAAQRRGQLLMPATVERRVRAPGMNLSERLG